MGQRLVSTIVAFVAVGAVGLVQPAAVSAANGAIGYAYVKYLEEGAGSAPVGAFLSFHGVNRTSLEIDLGYHRDSEGDFTLHTFTATAGPRFSGGSDSGAVPFLHVLGGVRYDRVEDEGNSSFGGMAGIGVDLRTDGIGLRLGADFQVFFDEGENIKTLRLGVGITF